MSLYLPSRQWIHVNFVDILLISNLESMGGGISSIGIAIIKIRRYHNRLIFIMAIPMPGKTIFIFFILKQRPVASNLTGIVCSYGSGPQVVAGNEHGRNANEINYETDVEMENCRGHKGPPSEGRVGRPRLSRQWPHDSRRWPRQQSELVPFVARLSCRHTGARHGSDGSVALKNWSRIQFSPITFSKWFQRITFIVGGNKTIIYPCSLCYF